MRNKIKFIDLFSGIGGLRIGFEQALKEMNFSFECVGSSEIKEHAIRALNDNFLEVNNFGDITKLDAASIPDFDFLLAGFPCQSFSFAGKGLGFLDTRGTLFFDVERILREKKPFGFILENVEGLVSHDKDDSKQAIGKTLSVILNSLTQLGYKVTWKVLDSSDFGVPQTRKRIFIVGSKSKTINLDNFVRVDSKLNQILEKNRKTVKSEFTEKLLTVYKKEDLYGKAIKDKRGGSNNIHSWDINLKGEISLEQRIIMNNLFLQRRRKKWAENIGIDWMDGMPLTKDQIRTFCNFENLDFLLADLVMKNYLVYEHPKKLVNYLINDVIVKNRIYDYEKEKGYNIVTGKLSFEFSKILDPNSIAPTLVATDVSKIGVIDGQGIRQLTIREGLRLFGFPDNYNLSQFENDRKGLSKAFDLLGNTVVIPVVKEVSKRVIESLID